MERIHFSLVSLTLLLLRVLTLPSLGLGRKHISSTPVDPSLVRRMLLTLTAVEQKAQRMKQWTELGDHAKALGEHCRCTYGQAQDQRQRAAQLHASAAHQSRDRHSPQHQVESLQVGSKSQFLWCCIILLLYSHPLWACKAADSTEMTSAPMCASYRLFTALRLSQGFADFPFPPPESWRNAAQRVDVRIRLWQHESFIKIPVMLSSLAGALRPYFAESNFRFRHKYVLLVYHKLSAHCCSLRASCCWSCTAQLSPLSSATSALWWHTDKSSVSFTFLQRYILFCHEISRSNYFFLCASY